MLLRLFFLLAYALLALPANLLAQGGPPVITQQPTNQSVNVGGTATFAVSVSSGSPVAYQWRFNGGNISGATLNSYTIVGVQANQAGNYSVACTNAGGFVISSNATLTVNAPNLVPFQVPGWSDKIVVATGTNTSTDSSPLTTTNTLYVKWAVANNGNASTSVTFSNELDVDGVLFAIGYVPPPMPPSSFAAAPYQALPILSAGTHTVKLIVDSANNVAESNESDNQYTKTITVYAPPVLTNPPAGFLIASTYTASFTAGASGSFPLTYRWFKNGSIVGGATGSTLTFTNVNMNTAGAYSVTVSNGGGSVSSSPPAVLTVEPALAVFTLAGKAGVLTNNDGFGTNAGFEEPTGIAVDAGGNAYVVDFIANNIRKITPAGLVSTIAGSPSGFAGSADGIGTNAEFWNPYGIALDSGGNLYVTDQAFGTVRRIVPTGSNWVVSTIAGGFFVPQGIAVDTATNVYVSDFQRSTISKITPSGTNWAVTVIAGQSNIFGASDGIGTNALFARPNGLAFDPAGNLYVADWNNDTIRKISPSGTNWVVTTFAGQAGTSGTKDGVGPAARFTEPADVAVDGAGNIYVVENFFNTVRKITSGAVVDTMAGGNTFGGSMDGTGRNALLNSPNGVAIAPDGAVYVADQGNGTVRKGVVDYGQPIITRQPQSFTVGAGSNGVFGVSVIGNAPLGYQWDFNGANLADSTQVSGSQSATVTINFAQPTNGGSYFVQVSNAFGVCASTVATLEVDPSVHLSAPRYTNNAFQFRLTGAAGGYNILASSNLVNWLVIGTTSTPTGVIDFVDATSSGFSRRFYRSQAQ